MTENGRVAGRSGYVSIVGAPNVGKSTLMNRMVGEKLAIVSSRPQTTRNRILAVHTRPDFQMVFLDTPGIHRPKEGLNRYMVEAALSAAGEADVVLLVIDAAFPWGPLDRLALEHLTEIRVPVVLAVNKIDLVDRERLLRILAQSAELHDFTEIFPVSAAKGEGVAELEESLARLLPEGPPYFPEDQLSDLPERFLAAETVREKVFRLTRQELPYSTAVAIESFEELEEQNLLRIRAEIVVERDSQKGMIIGKGGAMLKKIGQAARQDLEEFFAVRVYLELFVKVEKNWTRDPRALKRLGYT